VHSVCISHITQRFQVGKI